MSDQEKKHIRQQEENDRYIKQKYQEFVTSSKAEATEVDKHIVSAHHGFAATFNYLLNASRLGENVYVDFPDYNGENFRMYSFDLMTIRNEKRYAVLQDYYKRVIGEDIENLNGFYIDGDGKYTADSSKAMAEIIFDLEGKSKDEKLKIFEAWSKYVDGISNQENLDPLMHMLKDIKDITNDQEHANTDNLTNIFNRYKDTVFDDRWIPYALDQFGGKNGRMLSSMFKDYLNQNLREFSPFYNDENDTTDNHNNESGMNSSLSVDDNLSMIDKKPKKGENKNLVTEDKFAQIYGKAKGKIQETLGKIKEKIFPKSKDETNSREH